MLFQQAVLIRHLQEQHYQQYMKVYLEQQQQQQQQQQKAQVNGNDQRQQQQQQEKKDDQQDDTETEDDVSECEHFTHLDKHVWFYLNKSWRCVLRTWNICSDKIRGLKYAARDAFWEF